MKQETLDYIKDTCAKHNVALEFYDIHIEESTYHAKARRLDLGTLYFDDFRDDAIALHEVAHIKQHDEGYIPMRLMHAGFFPKTMQIIVEANATEMAIYSMVYELPTDHYSFEKGRKYLQEKLKEYKK